jgi:hypothetical protein
LPQGPISARSDWVSFFEREHWQPKRKESEKLHPKPVFPSPMSENSLESTERSGHHGLRSCLKVEHVRPSLLDNLFYAMNRRILLPELARKISEDCARSGLIGFLYFSETAGIDFVFRSCVPPSVTMVVQARLALRHRCGGLVAFGQRVCRRSTRDKKLGTRPRAGERARFRDRAIGGKSRANF